MTSFQRIGRFRSAGEFAEYLRGVDATLPFEDPVLSAAEGSPLAGPIRVGGHVVGNRWCIHPMEGWDATEDGRPTERTVRRWRHFGQSGAKLIWGGEAVAVRRDGRANPHQLYYRPENADAFGQLRAALVAAHAERFGPAAPGDLLVGLQLTHSGRFCRPNRHDRLEPRIAYHHPVLDARVGIRPDDDSVVRRIKEAVPGLPIVGTAYSYFQEYLPNVAQAVVRRGWTDLVGIGRMALSYWDLPADVLSGRALDRKRICRTFSDCTTGPRCGLPSGCFPLDPHYKTSPEAAELKQAKAKLKERLAGPEGATPG